LTPNQNTQQTTYIPAIYLHFNLTLEGKDTVLEMVNDNVEIAGLETMGKIIHQDTWQTRIGKVDFRKCALNRSFQDLVAP
jgi:hypothetical protein